MKKANFWKSACVLAWLGLCALSAAGATRSVVVNGQRWFYDGDDPTLSINGNIVTIHATSETTVTNHSLSTGLDLTPYTNQDLRVELALSGENLSTNVTFSFLYRVSGTVMWYSCDETGTFAQKTLSMGIPVASRHHVPDNANGWLGIAMKPGTGDLVIDLGSFVARSIPFVYPQTNETYTVSYPERVTQRAQKRGVSMPLRQYTEDDFRTLWDWGVTLVRFNGNGHGKDLLPQEGESEADCIARFDASYAGLLDHLENDILPWAEKYGIDIIFGVAGPPGGYGSTEGWNCSCPMFNNDAYKERFISFWREIATRFRGQGRIYGYDIQNEPQHRIGVKWDYWTLQCLAAEAIRAIDPDVTLIMEANHNDTEGAFDYLSPLAMDNVIYEHHLYNPTAFTFQGFQANANCYCSWPDAAKGWSKAYLEELLEPVAAFAEKHKARIYIGEFSAVSWAESGADQYLADVMAICNERGWDWTYHAFRESAMWDVEKSVTANWQPTTYDPARKNALLAGLRYAADAKTPTTWYWNPTHAETRVNVQRNTTSFGPFYWWSDDANWTNALGQAGHPAAGDTMVAGLAGEQTQVYGVCAERQEDGFYPAATATNALKGITILAPVYLNQGNVTLAAGSDCTGLVYAGTKSQYNPLGLVLTGTGLAPIDIQNACTYTLQMRMTCQPTDARVALVKRGIGRFVCYYQSTGYPYDIPETRIQAGTFTPNSALVGLTGKEVFFDGDDASQRLELGYGKDYQCDFILQDARFGEINGADQNHAHGIVSDYDHVLTFTGTPKDKTTVFTGAFYQKAGLCWAPDSDDYTFVISGSASPTQGHLEVRRGTVCLTNAASFAALSNVTVAAGATLKIDAGCSLACASATVGGTTLAAGTYGAAAAGFTGAGSLVVDPAILADYATDALVLTVPSGVTRTLAEALAAYNEENGTSYTVDDLNGGSLATCQLAKAGPGTLKADQTISSFKGVVDIREGIVEVEAQYGLGKSDNDAAPIYVRSGATMRCPYTKERDNVTRNGSRIVHIAGTGVNGQGALYAGTAFLYYGSVSIFGKEIILDDDALVQHGSWYKPAGTLTLNGHTLTLKCTSSGSPVFFDTLKGRGSVRFRDSQIRSAPNFSDTTDGNTLVFENGGGARFWRCSYSGLGLKTWRYVFNGANTYLYGDDDVGLWTTRDSLRNTIWGPTFVTNTVTLTSQGNTKITQIYLRGPIQGTGKFAIAGSSEMGCLHLMNPGNAFTGGAEVRRGILCAYGDGSLPAADGAVWLNRSTAYAYTKNAEMYRRPEFYGVALFDPGFCRLPPLVQTGDAADPGRVQGGRGRWQRVEKSGTSTLEFFSETGAPLLDVKAGTVKLPRGAAPGLWEGTNLYASAALAAEAFTSGAAATNLVMRGPTSANLIDYQCPSVGAEARLITDTGWIWNRDATNVTWSFASALSGPCRLEIDGASVFDLAANARQSANVTLTPGPHAFAWRARNAQPVASAGAWPAKFGFVYDRFGRNDLASTNNYAHCVDPGDGSLFTRETNAVACLPSFDAIRLARGAALNLNGNTYRVNDISGFGAVTSSATDASADARLVVTNRLTVDLGTVGQGALASAVPLSFAAGARVYVTNNLVDAHGAYTIATAPSITAPGRIRAAVAAGRPAWVTEVVDAEGGLKALRLVHVAGTMLLVR